MPAKTEPASAQRTKDALWVFDQLMGLRSPVIIDVNAVAAKENAKVNTIVKRFPTLRLRYPGLSIQATTTASGKPARTITTTQESPSTAPKTPKTRAGKRKAGIPSTDTRLEPSKRPHRERESVTPAPPDDDETVKAADDQDNEPDAYEADVDIRPLTGGYEWQTYAEEVEGEY